MNERSCKDCMSHFWQLAKKRARCNAVLPARKVQSTSVHSLSNRGDILIAAQESDLLEVVRTQRDSARGAANVMLRRNDFRSSTKLDALADNLSRFYPLEFSGLLPVDHIGRVQDQDPCFRAV